MREQLASVICSDRAVDNWQATPSDYDLADAIIAALPGLVKPLEWSVDDRTLHLDGTMMMGKGYDWDGFEVMRQEARAEGFGYIIWPDSISSRRFSMYATKDGTYMQDLTEEEAREAAKRHHVAQVMAAFGIDAGAMREAFD